MEDGIKWLESILSQVRRSSIYETSCARHSGKPYINAVVEGYFQGNGLELEDLLKKKEKEMGRTIACREKGDVPIDMDIVMMDGEILKPWDFRQKFFQIGFSQLNDSAGTNL